MTYAVLCSQTETHWQLSRFFFCVHGMRTNTYIHRYKKDDGDGDGDGDGTEEGHEDTAPQQEPFAGAADDTPLVV